MQEIEKLQELAAETTASRAGLEEENAGVLNEKKGGNDILAGEAVEEPQEKIIGETQEDRMVKGTAMIDGKAEKDLSDTNMNQEEREKDQGGGEEKFLNQIIKAEVHGKEEQGAEIKVDGEAAKENENVLENYKDAKLETEKQDENPEEKGEEQTKGGEGLKEFEIFKGDEVKKEEEERTKDEQKEVQASTKDEDEEVQVRTEDEEKKVVPEKAADEDEKVEEKMKDEEMKEVEERIEEEERKEVLEKTEDEEMKEVQEIEGGKEEVVDEEKKGVQKSAEDEKMQDESKEIAAEEKEKDQDKEKSKQRSSQKVQKTDIIDGEKTPKTSIERPIRERKTVERLVETVEKWSPKDFVVVKGTGTPLKDIPNVARRLSRKKPDDIKLIHNLLFGRKGKAVDHKSHILQFSGFAWHENELDREKTKLKEKLEKNVKDKLLDLCNLFDLPDSKPSSRKEDLVEHLADFLAAPHSKMISKDAEKVQSPSTAKRKRTARSPHEKNSSDTGKHSGNKRAKTESLQKTQGRTNEADMEDTHDDKKAGPHSSDGHEDGLAGISEEEEKEDKTNKGGEDSSKKVSRKRSSSRSATDKKPTTPVKSPVKASSKHSAKAEPKERVLSRRKTHETTKASSKDKKSSGKKPGQSKTPDSSPTEKELKDKICAILKEIDFNTATFRDILKKLSEHYKKDLTARKALIKLLIQDELTRLAEESEDEE